MDGSGLLFFPSKSFHNVPQNPWKSAPFVQKGKAAWGKAFDGCEDVVT